MENKLIEVLFHENSGLKIYHQQKLANTLGMHELFVRLSERNLEDVADEILTSEEIKKEKLINSLVTIVGIMPWNVLLFARLIKLIKIDGEIVKMLGQELEKQICESVEQKKIVAYLSFLRLLYVLEYLNVFESNITTAIDLVNESVRSIIFDCKGIDRNKLLVKKEDESIEMGVQIKVDSLFIAEVGKYIETFAQTAKKVGMIDNDSIGDVFMARYLVESINFDKHECCMQINCYFDENNYHELIIGILSAREATPDNSIFFRFVLVSLGKHRGFLSVFYKFLLSINKNKFLYSVLALIYETYYAVPPKNQSYTSYHYQPQLNEAEIDTFKSFIDESLAIEMIKYSNLQFLRNFLPENCFHLMPEEKNFENIRLKRMADDDDMESVKKMSKNDFFEQFCKISYPSVSHFLIYLETFAIYFNLSQEEQRAFLNIFYQINENKFSYLEHIGKKLLLFKVIDQSVADEYPKIFH
ncbi:hypothetical protein VCUG_00394 [Vavraia culicis subsp. floridensis]|uniref:Uncharacterized protein n=1 Tax=Vavraia culicis (isolate floridensis) TaxID=948595 RepID=L2GWV3_VAVCU|nr:uncharacterized protein VCUG_00394 [Vavraia culicis subsp. floridensis]ELA48156.1 hypothetical protein VCUG_00394 [Vavraia culicis subsp. floridensis]